MSVCGILVSVGDVRLFVDVDGAKLVPDGETMRERPTIVLLHGGPGFDHTPYKAHFAELAEIAQVVYYDHRGNGRSEDGPREGWNLAQWGDDVRAFCEGKIARHKVPRYVKLVDAFPMTVTGKVQKFKMRETAIAELGLEAAAGVQTA